MSYNTVIISCSYRIVQVQNNFKSGCLMLLTPIKVVVLRFCFCLFVCLCFVCFVCFCGCFCGFYNSLFIYVFTFTQFVFQRMLRKSFRNRFEYSYI